MQAEAALLLAFAHSGKFEATTIDLGHTLSMSAKRALRGGDPRGTFGTLWYLRRPAGLKKLEILETIRGLKMGADAWKAPPHLRPRLRNLSLLPNRNYEGARKRALRGSMRRDLALTGIALERYRLKHGAVPEKLDALVPEFLLEVPKDIYDGRPLRYQVLPDGSPHVWSIGPSGKDEGGIPNWYGEMNTAWSTGQIPGLTEAVYNSR